MDAKFFSNHLLSAHRYVERSLAAESGLAFRLRNGNAAEQTLALESYLRLSALTDMVKHYCTQLGMSFEQLQTYSADELKIDLESSAEARIDHVYRHVFRPLLQLGDCSFETVATGYIKALAEVRAVIERTFWPLEALVAMPLSVPL
jgi:hypothetical protein